jgi:uncharacterized protein YcaQ
VSLHLDNRTARRLFLAKHALSAPTGGRLSGPGLRDLVTELGFVQVDSIRTVERAHHMILFARRRAYRQAQLDRLVERERSLFEGWTHDAALIPTAFYPVWMARFARRAAYLRQRFERFRGPDSLNKTEEVLAHIATHGPVRAGHLREEDHESGGWWNWAPSKSALEFLWHTGRLAVTRREGFQKVYDLTENVVPAAHRDPAAVPDPAGLVDWSCRTALDRLGFATAGELARFWDHVTPQEAAGWIAAQGDALVPVTLAGTDGKSRPAVAWAGLAGALDALPEPPAGLRVLSPFDPLLRDRQRTERLFGFSFRIEVFVPEPQRRYGYYVFPLLEGDRLVGRADIQADRTADALRVAALWWEPGLRRSKLRQRRLEAELERLARFAGVSRVVFADGWERRDRR